MITAVKNRLIEALKWSEKYTKTDMVYLATGGSWLLSAQFVNFVSAFFLLWLFANFLPKEVYGQYRFLITIVALLGLFALPGMNTAVVGATALNKTGTYKLAIRQKLLWGTLAFLGGAVMSIYYFVQNDLTLSILFAIIAIFTPFISTYTLYESHLNGLKKFELMSVLQIIQRSVVVVTLVTAIFLTENIILILLAYLISMLFSFKLSEYIALRKYPLNDLNELDAIKYGKKLSLISALRSGSQYLDKISLWYFAGPVQVAQYVVAVSIPNEISAASGQLSKLALPKMSVRDKFELKNSLLRKVFIYFIFLIPVAILYIISVPIIFNTFLPQYQDSIFFSQLASLLILSAPIGLLTQYFYATKHIKALYVVNIIEPIVLIICYMALIPLFGIIGVITASLVRFVIIFIMLVYYLLNEEVTSLV